MSDLAGLIERVREATGADREIDAAIYDALVREAGRVAFKVSDWSRLPGSRLSRFHDGWLVGYTRDDEYADDLPHYSNSIDASVKLAESIAHPHGRKLICFFCAGGQLTSENADPQGVDYHPLAKIDNSVTAGWLSHIAFFKPEGSESYGPEEYTHGHTAGLAIVGALLKALTSLQDTTHAK